MLTININLEDRLVSGLVGKAMYLRYVNDKVKVIYMKFNDQNAGQQATQPDNETGYLSRNMKRLS